MEHEIKYDQANDLVVLEFKNHFLLKDVDPIFDAAKKILEGKPFRQIIVVMSDSHNVENRETRERTSEELENAGISDVAFVGGNAANRMIARVLIKTGLIKISGDFFKEYNDAVEWLKSKR